ncbi:MAG: HD domain-containing protein [Polyangiaceae bacterium]|nr:HD domain-containing protein [Polyangiaceae bacterium]
MSQEGATTTEQEQAHIEAALAALDNAAHQAESDNPSPGSPQNVNATTPDYKLAAKHEKSKVRAQLDRILMGPNPDYGLDALLDCGALYILLPEVHALVGFGDGEWLHKDVWKHTKQVVYQAEPIIELRWSALLHDIGKPQTRSIAPDGEVHFFGHAELGARMFDRIERRLHLFAQDPSLKKSIRFLILHHLRANQYERTWTDSAVRRFAREIGAELDNLLLLSRADITTKRPEKKTRGLEQLDELSARITELAEIDAIVPPLPSGVGNDIMQVFGLPPSRLIGDIKRALETAIENEEILSHQGSEYYVDLLRANPGRFGIPE